MSFNTLFFLFAFLPVALILYNVTPKNTTVKNAVLVILSLLFYAWGTPEYLVLLLFSIVFNYVTVLEIEKLREDGQDRYAKMAMISAVVMNLLILGFFKYYGFLINNINAITHLHLTYTKLSLPLGVSFYTFTVLSYVLDVYMGKAEAQHNLLKFSVYVSFFPKLVMGPIVAYRDMEEQLNDPHRRTTKTMLHDGVVLFLVGLFKKVLLADNLSVGFTAISGMTSMSVVTAWLGMIFYSLELYFDFSGYSDMAIGLAKMFGFNFGNNFDHPYIADSISDFWRRWHITLGAWFRNYVYIPLGGNRCSTSRQLMNLGVVWLLTGLWHGASWSFVVWGLWHGFWQIIEKFVLKDFRERLPHAVRVGITVLLVFFGWVFFFSDTLPDALHYFGQMFGMGHMGFLDSTAKYYLSGNLLLLIISAIGCGPLVQRMHNNLVYRKGGKMIYLSVAIFVILFLLSIAYLVSSTYSSFLYFQF